MTVNSSCTYRAISQCGYIRADLRIPNQTFLNDFDIAWATKDDIDEYKDLDRYDYNLTTDWNNSFQSNRENYTLDIASE